MKKYNRWLKLAGLITCMSLILGLSGCMKSQAPIAETEMIAQDSDSAEAEAETMEIVSETQAPETEMIETERDTEEVDIEPGSEETEETEIEDPLIIVLDAGHDSEYCARNHPQLGVNEQDLNLAIAKACKKRLEKYAGVVVLMTRTDGNCPNADNGGEYCIEARTGYATDMGADLFVSLHNNGTTGNLGDSSGGTEVYVPNYKAYTDDMKALGQIVLDHLSELDLTPRGVFVRTNEEKGCYDDGSVQDFYYLLSYSVEGGHPAMIIEHAYMDSTHDNQLLRDEKMLKAMGRADADAIAEYYGLSLQ